MRYKPVALIFNMWDKVRAMIIRSSNNNTEQLTTVRTASEQQIPMVRETISKQIITQQTEEHNTINKGIWCTNAWP